MRAAELQDSMISFINFTPNEAYERCQGIRDICEDITTPDPNNAKTHIRPGKSDLEILSKEILQEIQNMKDIC